uniref:Uncharacterized protein n=1 Tax=Rhizophora mucronata TaxID=61149 RepID=A0A2P2N783_RHIMU
MADVIDKPLFVVPTQISMKTS